MPAKEEISNVLLGFTFQNSFFDLTLNIKNLSVISSIKNAKVWNSARLILKSENPIGISSKACIIKLIPNIPETFIIVPTFHMSGFFEKDVLSVAIDILIISLVNIKRTRRNGVIGINLNTMNTIATNAII